MSMDRPFPAEILRAVMADWCGPLESWIATPRAGPPGYWSRLTWDGASNHEARPDPAVIRLPLRRAEARHRLAVVLAAGIPCTTCNGTGKVSDAEALSDLALRAGEATAHAFPALANFGRRACRACSGGYTRPRAPVWWALPEAEGGHLTAAQLPGLAGTVEEASATILACSAERVARGMGAVVGILDEAVPGPDGVPIRPLLVGPRLDACAWRFAGGRWFAVATPDGDRESLAAGFGRLDHGRLVLPFPTCSAPSALGPCVRRPGHPGDLHTPDAEVAAELDRRA